jgi:tRNA (guanine-N7-)-methyltransferase
VRRRQHVNPLGLGLSRRRASVPEIPAGRPLEIEVGCADAQFLFERALRDPDRFYVGIDTRHQFIDGINRRAAAEARPVLGVFGHANHHLASMFAPGRASRVFVNFPDPWFKRRHHKRRMLDRDLACSIHTVLEPGGELLFQTDVWAIALDALAVLDGLDDRYANAAGPWSFWKGPNPFGARSWREQHCEEDGLPIWRLLYRSIQPPRG